MHRVSAIGMLTLVPATVMTGAGSVPACALSVMAPYHFSLGVESAIDDYCPVGDIKVRIMLVSVCGHATCAL